MYEHQRELLFIYFFQYLYTQKYICHVILLLFILIWRKSTIMTHRVVCCRTIINVPNTGKVLLLFRTVEIKFSAKNIVLFNAHVSVLNPLIYYYNIVFYYAYTDTANI